ncbi:hypothetical protein Bpla01_43530 [Burkholderia plantarii]|nr:hypothetical protein Bpla01_43530 [Burkholderia plantarii]
MSLTGAPVAWVNGAVAVVLSDMDFLLNGRGEARAGLGEPAREDAGRRSPPLGDRRPGCRGTQPGSREPRRLLCRKTQ